jgi:predicted secreted hydrolase
VSENATSELNLRTILESTQSKIQDLFDFAADAISGEASELRDGTELDPVSLPRDLFAHHNAQTEWWYYTGHLETESDREFAFELVFFKRRTDLDRFGYVPLRLLGNPIYFAHFALTDSQNSGFRYSHRKSSNGWTDRPAAASEDHYYLRLGDWIVRESHGSHVLRASINSEVAFEANLVPEKTAVLNGPGRDGVSFKDEGEASRYFSYTRMGMEGDLTIDGKVEHFAGTAWMDREFGTWTATEKQKGWDWFSIQLEDGTELMCYQLRDGQNAVSEYSSGVFVSKDGTYSPLAKEDFSIKPKGFWKSARTGATYPSGWQVSVPGIGMEVSVIPVCEDQELDTRGTTMIVYWEGACRVTANRNGEVLKGRAYVELVGYDRSHDSPNLAHFLMGSEFDHPPRTIFG